MLKIAKIFIVDDDTDIVLLFEQFLVIEGHEVVAKAYNGEEAIETFKNLRAKPDIILMDHRMPQKNGIETIKEIISMDSDSRIIFISADYTVRNKALEIGAIDFLEKPINFTSLIEIVKKYSPIKNQIT